ncbi:MAG: 3-isopropylmalate dehydratase small subunit [Peptostreptococcaceae bacterium]|nr:3-isopropylmalate dehydratase small subunit [Peptostreptococcaceae bacterium]
MSKGKAHVYGNNVDTDVIIPARYLGASKADELAAHCMEDIDKEFKKRVEQGDVIIAGLNFGCGSSREHAPMAIKASGISCVVASSYSRIFFRNAFNIGLPIFVCAEAGESAETGDEISVDLESGIIINETRNETYRAQAIPPFMMDMIKKGGLMAKIAGEKEDKR